MASTVFNRPITLQPPDHAQKERKNNPAQQLPKIVSGGGQQGVDLVARFTRPMIATQPVVALARSRNARLATEFVTLMRFALRDAPHFGSVNAVEFVLAGASLSKQSMR